MNEIQAFLSTCRYVSDQEQFGVPDHWAVPEQFEQTRQGDCDDFALWTWRQLLDLGFSARFVVGSAGRYGSGHAWVTVRVRDKTFLVEPLLTRVGRTFSRLETLRYKPRVSVEMNDGRVQFFEHSTCPNEPALRVVAPLVPEWLLYRVRILSIWIRWPFVALTRRFWRKYQRSTR